MLHALCSVKALGDTAGSWEKGYSRGQLLVQKNPEEEYQICFWKGSFGQAFCFYAVLGTGKMMLKIGEIALFARARYFQLLQLFFPGEGKD